MHRPNGLIPVDRNPIPLRIAIILWDQRSLPEVDHMRNVLGEQATFYTPGNPAAQSAGSLPLQGANLKEAQIDILSCLTAFSYHLQLFEVMSEP